MLHSESELSALSSLLLLTECISIVEVYLPFWAYKKVKKNGKVKSANQENKKTD